MDSTELAGIYRRYIACLNGQQWPELGRFVHDAVSHNGRRLGLGGYQAMLEDDYRLIPDLRFNIDLLVCEPPSVACRLAFDCSPHGVFLGLDLDGRRVRFAENVFYRFEAAKIIEVWSVLDKSAIEAQLARGGA